MSNKHLQARLHVKRLKDTHGGYKAFYEVLYGHAAENQNELQRFINYVNRGLYNLDFLLLLVTNAGLTGLTMEAFLLGEAVKEE